MCLFISRTRKRKSFRSIFRLYAPLFFMSVICYLSYLSLLFKAYSIRPKILIKIGDSSPVSRVLGIPSSLRSIFIFYLTYPHFYAMAMLYDFFIYWVSLVVSDYFLLYCVTFYETGYRIAASKNLISSSRV